VRWKIQSQSFSLVLNLLCSLSRCTCSPLSEFSSAGYSPAQSPASLLCDFPWSQKSPLRLQKGILQKSLLGFLSSSVADCNFVPFSSLFLPFYYGFSQKEQMVHFLFYFNLESFLASLSLRAPSLIFLSPLRLVCKSCFSSACFGPGSESLCCVVHLGVIWCRC
jgi:hypothetical protein